MTRLYLLFLCCFLQIGLLHSQDQSRKLYSLAQVTEDFDYYITALKGNHPNIHAFITEKELNKELGRVRNQLTDSMSLFEFGKALFSLQHCFDGHSGIYYMDFGASCFKEKAPYLYPDSLTNDAIYLNGRKVTAINGISSREIVQRMKRYVNSEDNPALVQCQLRMCFPHLSYYLLDLVPPYRITYQDKKGKHITQVEPVEDSSIMSRYDGTFICEPFLFKSYPESSIAQIDFNRCDLEALGGEANFELMLDSIFKEIKHYKYLFIDISRNTGGNDRVCYALFNRLKHDGIQTTIRNIPSSKGTVHYKLPQSTDGYEGTVFMIAGPWTYSSGYIFWWIMQTSQRGVFVGQSPGHLRAMYAPVSYANLPNTGLSFHYPTGGEYWKANITPDIPWNLDCFHSSFTLEELKKVIELYNHKSMKSRK